jgi:hypothetical protein
MKKKLLNLAFLAALAGLTPCFAQFSSSLQGVVQDSHENVIPGASVQIVNTATGVSQIATSGAKGDFRFVSLAPGVYTVTASSSGFAAARATVTLTTDEIMNLPVTLQVASQTTNLEVSAQAPVLDTADSRTQQTLDSAALSNLPLPGHSLLSLVTTAPGVTGLGILSGGGNGQSNDNFAAETSVSASANGRSSVGNMYVADGLDITSNITPGVLNLVPNPDTVQETTVQVNTYSVEYGRNSSIVEVMTTKSGTSQYHGLLSDYFTNQMLTAGTEFVHSYAPFHTNNMSATLGGPIPHVHQMYFFTGWEPLLGLTATGNNSYIFEDPQFTAWAKQNYPNNPGTQLLEQYGPANASDLAVKETAAQLYGTGANGCGTAATANIPCSLPVFDSGIFNASNYRNALQYNVRIDKYFNKDRVYGNYYNTTLQTGGPALRTDMASSSQYSVHSIQANETHTFSTDSINEAAFGFLRMEGLLHPAGPFHVPIVSVVGWSANIGVTQAHEDYVQHKYVWRDTFMHMHKTHELQFGYEGFHGDNLTYFGEWFSQPQLTFEDPVSLVLGNVYSETGVAYNPVNGQQAGLSGDSFQLHGSNLGLFAQDTWKAGNRLTLTYGLRFDDFGNPSPENGSPLANFFYGAGSTIPQQVADGSVIQTSHSFNHALTAFSPRVGVALDPTGHSTWVVRGGVGLYHDWVTLGNVQNEFSNPPASTTPTFITGTTTAPIFSIGTSDTYPFGFTYPAFPGYGLNQWGGYANSTVQLNISGNDPNLRPSNTLNYSIDIARSVGHNLTASAGYSGSHSSDLFTDFAGHTGNAYYGYDINNFPGSLIQNNGKLVRLNPNFGSIRYTVNGPASTYNAFIAEFRGRFAGRGFIDLSYTRSSSWDDAGTYPTVASNSGNFSQYWSPSNWDTPNRVSLVLSYELPGLQAKAFRLISPAANGWRVSAVTILQSGTPFTVANTAAFAPVCSSGKPSGGVCPAGTTVIGNTGGDYNADGNNNDYPNVTPAAHQVSKSRSAYLQGIYGATTSLTSAALQQYFPTPAFGTEGNETPNSFRNPGYADTDLRLAKSTPVHEGMTFEFMAEAFNAFNRPNLGGVGTSINSLSSFGRVSSMYNSRFFQLGGKLQF